MRHPIILQPASHPLHAKIDQTRTEGETEEQSQRRELASCLHSLSLSLCAIRLPRAAAGRRSSKRAPREMEPLQSHRVEMLSIAVALVAIGAGTAYYFYLQKKPKGTPLPRARRPVSVSPSRGSSGFPPEIEIRSASFDFD